MAEAARQDLAWLGLTTDGPELVQSSRAGELAAIAGELLERGLAYPCVCTRREVAAARSAPHAGEEGPAYPGTCRGRYTSLEEARADSGREPALRVRVPSSPVRFEDRLHGVLEEDLSSTVGDFPITSRDGQVAYQLAVVLDDAHQGVTQVVRGSDLLESTARQAFLHDLLGLARPEWIHVPLVVDDAGERLAKRHDALAIVRLREAGLPAEALVGWCARSAGIPVEGGASAAEVLERFDPDDLDRRPAVFGREALEELGMQGLDGAAGAP
jgi:glutamyl-tRNA synthetase